MKRTVTLDFTKLKNAKYYSVRSVTLREVAGPDEKYAMKEALTKKTNLGEELIRLSIEKVDGEPVSQPFTDLDAWNEKTRNSILKAFERLNGAMSDEEMDGFFGETEADPSASAK